MIGSAYRRTYLAPSLRLRRNLVQRKPCTIFWHPRVTNNAAHRADIIIFKVARRIEVVVHTLSCLMGSLFNRIALARCKMALVYTKFLICQDVLLHSNGMIFFRCRSRAQGFD